MTTGSGGLQRHENADIFVSNPKEHFMGTIITRSDKEVLHFFDEMKRVSDLIDHLQADNRHLLDGENYLTDTELAGKLKLSKRTLLDYRSSGILPYYQIGGKILYRESDIVRLLEKNRKERSVLTSDSIYGKEGALQNVHFDAPSCCYNMYSRCTSVNSYLIRL